MTKFGSAYLCHIIPSDPGLAFNSASHIQPDTLKNLKLGKCTVLWFTARVYIGIAIEFILLLQVTHVGKRNVCD